MIEDKINDKKEEDSSTENKSVEEKSSETTIKNDGGIYKNIKMTKEQSTKLVIVMAIILVSVMVLAILLSRK